MWTVMELRRPLGSILIKEIKLNAKSRDDTPALLREVGRLVARTGAKLSGKKRGAALVGRCDSFVMDGVHLTDFGEV